MSYVQEHTNDDVQDVRSGLYPKGSFQYPLEGFMLRAP